MHDIYQQVEEITDTPIPLIQPDGTIHRFGSKKQWWIVIHSVGGNYYGAIGNWKTGMITKLGSKASASKYTQRIVNRQIREQIVRQRQEKEVMHISVAQQAQEIWNKAKSATATNYTTKKRIKPFGAHQRGTTLILPLVDVSGQIWSLQRIFPNGDKRFLAGGRKKACFIPVAWKTDTDKLIICEGWATGCSLAEMYPEAAVVAACDAGNLIHVTHAFRTQYPDINITIAADADAVGIAKAEHAAHSYGCTVITPNFPADAPEGLSDFNDLAVMLEGVNHG